MFIYFNVHKNRWEEDPDRSVEGGAEFCSCSRCQEEFVNKVRPLNEPAE